MTTTKPHNQRYAALLCLVWYRLAL